MAARASSSPFVRRLRRPRAAMGRRARRRRRRAGRGRLVARDRPRRRRAVPQAVRPRGAGPPDQHGVPGAHHVPRQREPQLLRGGPGAVRPGGAVDLPLERHEALRDVGRDPDRAEEALVRDRLDRPAERGAVEGRPAPRCASARSTTTTTSSTRGPACRRTPTSSPATSRRAQRRPTPTATRSTTRGSRDNQLRVVAMDRAAADGAVAGGRTYVGARTIVERRLGRRAARRSGTTSWRAARTAGST